MATTVCTRKDISVYSVHNGFKYHGPIDETGAELVDWETTSERDCRYYFCGNCGQNFDGRESFAEARSHLGQLMTIKDY